MPAIDYSFAGRIGHAMTAIFAPIGFNWQICIALIPGMAAREVAVSSLATVYAMSAADDDAAAQALTPLISDGWSLATARSLLVWFIYAPMCISTLATIKRETNSCRKMSFAMVYLFGLAYAASFVTYQVAVLLGRDERVVAVAIHGHRDGGAAERMGGGEEAVPGGVRKLRVAIALPLLREGKPAWLRSIGRRVSPATQAGGSACGGCDNCGPSTPKR